MVRTSFSRFFQPQGLLLRRVRAHARWITVSGALVFCGGCALAPRSQVDECHQLSRTLRSENARLKDQLLVVQAQNRDYADRAEDDSRRLASQDKAIEQFESSVRAYQDDRAHLEAAYHQLASSLGESRAKADERLSQASPAPPAKKKSRTQSTSSRAAQDGGDRDGEGTRK
jgi:peptidoglycan hydrolase CwlO-like protein